MANEVAKANTNNTLPAHLQGQGKTSRIGNLDQSDLILPRVKLIQAISPELDTFDAAKKGEFWHSIRGESLGNSLIGIPIVIRKSYILWAPRGDDRIILARAVDGQTWDNPNMEFAVDLKGVGKVTYNTKGSVKESGLDQFGSANPADSKSRPAATLTYNIMFYFPVLGSPAIVVNSRSGVKRAQDLNSKLYDAPTDHYNCLIEMRPSLEKGAEGPYYNWQYGRAGYADEATCKITKELYERYSDLAWRANEEGDEEGGQDTGPSAPTKGKVNPEMASKKGF